tara:strand:+ start:3349 stop:5076 length:1728 start_codon:yes stop_codon:yes gene_type:complete
MTRNVSNVPQRKCTLCLHERPETLYQGSSTTCAYCEADKRTNNEFAIKKRRRESPEMVQKAVEEKARSDEHLTEAQKKAKETLAIRQLSRRRLLPFVEQSKPRYLAGWVHKDICQRLERFEQDVLAQKSPRLMLFMPPRHGKSQIASIDFPAWFLGRNPELEIIASSYSASLAVGFSRKVRAQLRSPEYHAIFPKAHLDPDAQSADGWALLEGGGYVPAGVNGPVTGKGAHVFIIDDPVKNREEAESVVQRTNVLDWYTSTAYTRLAPGGGILLIMTRWHSVDLAGALIEAQKDGGDEWEIISYPAIATEDEEFRKAGEALHPERYNIENLQRIKRAIISVSGERDWEALYQQAPVSEEGDYFRRSDIKFYKPEDIADKPLRYYAAWDFAIGKKERNDYSVGLVVGVDQDDNIYIVDRIRGRFSGYDLVEKILDLYVKWKPSIVGLEKGMIEMSIGAFLEKRIAERRLWEIYLEELKPGRRDKEARARAIQGRIQQGKVFFPEKEVFTEALIKEMLFFPNGEHDDQVDALAWIGHMLAVFVGVRDEPEEKKKSWRDKLEKALQGGDTRKRSAMSA